GSFTCTTTGPPARPTLLVLRDAVPRLGSTGEPRSKKGRSLACAGVPPVPGHYIAMGLGMPTFSGSFGQDCEPGGVSDQRKRAEKDGMHRTDLATPERPCKYDTSSSPGEFSDYSRRHYNFCRRDFQQDFQKTAFLPHTVLIGCRRPLQGTPRLPKMT